MKNVKRLLSLLLCVALAAGLCLATAAQEIKPWVAAVFTIEDGADIEIDGNTLRIKDGSLAGFEIIDPVTGESLLGDEELTKVRQGLLSGDGFDFSELIEKYNLDLYFLGVINQVTSSEADGFQKIVFGEGSSTQSLIAKGGGRFYLRGGLRCGEVYGEGTRLHITGTAGTVQSYAGGFVGAKYGVVDFVNGSMNSTGGFRTRIADRDIGGGPHGPQLIEMDGVLGYYDGDDFVIVWRPAPAE